MSENSKAFRFSTRAMLAGVCLLSYVIAAFIRGAYLLGPQMGLVYGFVASLIAVLFYRALSDLRTTKLQLGVLFLTTALISVAFFFPGYLHPHFEDSINDNAADRNIRRELSEVFDSEPAFGNLSVSTKQYKCLVVEVSGTVPTASDLERLQRRCSMSVNRQHTAASTGAWRLGRWGARLVVVRTVAPQPPHPNPLPQDIRGYALRSGMQLARMTWGRGDKNRVWLFGFWNIEWRSMVATLVASSDHG